MIARIPTLTYLDDRPVFPNEREIVEAWNEDGLEGEKKAREAIAEREREQNQRNFDFMQAIRAEAFREVGTLKYGLLYTPTHGHVSFSGSGE